MCNSVIYVRTRPVESRSVIGVLLTVNGGRLVLLLE